MDKKNMTTKDMIIANSYKLFLKKGYKGVSMRDVLEATDLSKGGFYHYFKSKRELFRVIVEKYLYQASDTAFDFQDILKKSPEELLDFYHSQLSAMLEEFIASMDGEIEGVNFYLLIIDSLIYLPELENRQIKSQQREHMFWKKYLEKAIENDMIREDIDTDKMATIFRFLQDGVGMNGFLRNRTREMAATSKDLFRQIFDLMKK
jgi:AcrR family transcriptional regulator